MTIDPHGNSARSRLVVFGCGYVGAAVAERAIAEGLHVTALTRNPTTAAALRTAGAHVVVADLATDAWHDQIAGGADYVLDSVSAGGGGASGYRHSYIGGLESIARWAAAHGPVGTLVYTSSTSVYPQDGGVEVGESAAIGGDERAEILVAAERVAPMHPNAWRRWFVLRLAGIYGPGRHHLLEQVRAGVVTGNGGHRLNLAHRDDIATAIWASFRAPSTVANEVFNVCDDAAATKTEVVDWLAARVGVPTPSFSGTTAEGRRRITPDRIIVNRKIKSLLGWQPRFPSYREGYQGILG